MNDYSNYQSPFSFRYGTDAMRKIFSEENKFKTWRKIWVALAKAESKFGLVSKKELDDLEKHIDDVDIQRIQEIEKDTRHDVVSAIREFAEKAKVGGGKIHLGATSQDIGDNTEILRDKEALEIIEEKLIVNLKLFAEKVEKYADYPCMGYTHLQPAEPTTIGYRFAFYAQDLLTDLELLRFIKRTIKGKGLKGAVGTSASYTALLKDSKVSADELEKMFLNNLGLEAVDISSQVYPRKFDFLILSALASIASSLSKFAFDLRIMQSPGFGEWQEPFGEKQVGSSAMPFKKNPLISEKVCSLARYVNMLPSVPLENASVSLLERTLDDSANKRIIMPEAFLAVDEILETSEKLISGLVINENAIKNNLSKYGIFSSTESVILEVVKKGANRQRMHELLRELSMQAWNEIQAGKDNPMKKLLIVDKEINKYLSTEKVERLLDVSTHLGLAPKKAREFGKKIKQSLRDKSLKK